MVRRFAPKTGPLDPELVKAIEEAIAQLPEAAAQGLR